MDKNKFSDDVGSVINLISRHKFFYFLLPLFTVIGVLGLSYALLEPSNESISLIKIGSLNKQDFKKEVLNESNFATIFHENQELFVKSPSDMVKFIRDHVSIEDTSDLSNSISLKVKGLKNQEVRTLTSAIINNLIEHNRLFEEKVSSLNLTNELIEKQLDQLRKTRWGPVSDNKVLSFEHFSKINLLLSQKLKIELELSQLQRPKIIGNVYYHSNEIDYLSLALASLLLGIFLSLFFAFVIIWHANAPNFK